METLDPRIRTGEFLVITVSGVYTIVCDRKPSGQITFSGGSQSMPEQPGFAWRMDDGDREPLIQIGRRMTLAPHLTGAPLLFTSSVKGIIPTAGLTEAQIDEQITALRTQVAA